ncbi:MAG: insulinase family protein, partial [Geobacteraceae bacterium]|nr:insulinase family protein [Geobacteraceae bacterium]
MKIRLLCVCIVSLFTFSAAYGAEPANPRSMSFPALHFSIPKAERVQLKNGTPVYLLQDHELPIVTISALIRTGSVYDPADKSGLAALTGSQLRGGGTLSQTPAELDRELEYMASAVESSFGTDLGSVSLTSLAKNLDRTLQIFSDVLFRPRFDEKRLEVARRQALEMIRRQNDDPKELGDRELQKALYAGHPLGVVPTAATVSVIRQSDLQSFHQRFIRPDNMILTVAGDFDRTAMLAVLNRLIGQVKPEGPLRLPEVPQVKLQFAPAVLYAPKQVNQTVIRLGHLGITKDDPDLYAIRVLDFILGGSFTSRLMMEIRTNQGLAYNVGSHFDVGRRFTGSFTAETETKAEATSKTIGLMTSIIAEIRKNPVSEQELKLAKDSIINS